LAAETTRSDKLHPFLPKQITAMAQQDRLHALIRSMSGPEKGYFKRYGYKSERKNQRYLALFDALDRQQRYDEQALLLAFAEEAETRRLPAIKQHLYRMLLRTLLEYHSGKDPVDRMLQYIREARLLLHRGMPEAAKDKWSQASKHLERYDLQEYRTVLFEVEAGVLRYAASESDKLEQLIERQHQGIQLLQENFAYRARFSRYIQLALVHGFSLVQEVEARKAFHALLKEFEQVPDPGPELGFHPTYSHWMGLAGVHQALGNIAAMLQAGARVLEAFEQRPWFKAFKSKYYLQALNNRLNQFLLAEDYAAFDALVPEARAAIESAPKASEQRARRAFLENRILTRALLEGAPESLRSALQQQESHLCSFQSQPGLLYEARWTGLNAHWSLGDLDAVLLDVQTFLQDIGQTDRAHFAMDAQLLYRMVQWERGEHQHVRMSMDALRQYAKRHLPDRMPWPQVMRWFEALVASGTARQKTPQARWEELLEAVKQASPVHDNVFLTTLLRIAPKRLKPAADVTR
jgi:hypothetical protein